MAKGGNLHESNQRNLVPTNVLESVVNGSYDRNLTEEETGVLACAPQPVRPWFEEVVINGFYLKIRHLVKPTQASCTGPALLELLIAELTQNDYGKNPVKKNKTVLGTYVYRQNFRRGPKTHISHSSPFEQAIADILAAYESDLVRSVTTQYTNNGPFGYIRPNHVIEGLRGRLYG